MTLVSELRKINTTEYPKEACQMAALFLSVADYIADQLWKLRRQDCLKDIDLTRAMDLAAVIRKYYSYIRYLSASASKQTPPAIQLALTELSHHFHDPGRPPLALVRPQWKYNLTYTPISHYVLGHLDPFLFDPDGALSAHDSVTLLQELWDRARSLFGKDVGHEWPTAPPNNVAVLSFAGLDTDDTLLYPLLAHELGHFFDFCGEPCHSSTVSSLITLAEVEKAVLPLGAGQSESESYCENLNKIVKSAILELVADLLAARMMGLSFFMAQSEFLKTVQRGWPQSVVETIGYPGIA